MRYWSVHGGEYYDKIFDLSTSLLGLPLLALALKTNPNLQLAHGSERDHSSFESAHIEGDAFFGSDLRQTEKKTPSL